MLLLVPQRLRDPGLSRGIKSARRTEQDAGLWLDWPALAPLLPSVVSSSTRRDVQVPHVDALVILALHGVLAKHPHRHLVLLQVIATATPSSSPVLGGGGKGCGDVRGEQLRLPLQPRVIEPADRRAPVRVSNNMW